MVEPGQADGDVGRAAADVLCGLAVGIGDDVDECLADDEQALAHGASWRWGVAWSKSMEL
ncbi:hypothetical protein GCM10027080_06590 [Pedococcus soli]